MKDTGAVKNYFKAKTAEYPKGDDRFVKTEYSLTEEGAGFVFVSYMGDSRFGEAKSHGNSRRNARPHIRNAPLVKPKVVNQATLSIAPKTLYSELTGKLFLPCS